MRTVLILEIEKYPPADQIEMAIMKTIKRVISNNTNGNIVRYTKQATDKFAVRLIKQTVAQYTVTLRLLWENWHSSNITPAILAKIKAIHNR